MLATLFALRVVALASGGYAPRADPIIGLGRHLLGSDDAACSPGTHAQTCNATTSCEDCAPGYYSDGGSGHVSRCVGRLGIKPSCSLHEAAWGN